jgi:hypothetical protein
MFSSAFLVVGKWLLKSIENRRWTINPKNVEGIHLDFS